MVYSTQYDYLSQKHIANMAYKRMHRVTRLPVPDSLTPDNDRGKGTPRRKVKKVHKSTGTDDKKLQASLKKLNVQPIQAIEEVNMFKSDGNVIHFSAPKGTYRQIPHQL